MKGEVCGGWVEFLGLVALHTTPHEGALDGHLTSAF